MDAMLKKYVKKDNGIEYQLTDKGIYYPLIEMDNVDDYEIRKYGKLHEKYIRENNEVLYTQLLLQEKLEGYLQDVDKRAKELYVRVREAMIQKAEDAGEFKEVKNDYERSCLVNNIGVCAEEVVLSEVVYGE